MDYEKAYKEALCNAKKVLLDCTPEEQNVVEYIFPEFKESDDERIRKWLLDFVQGLPDEGLDFHFYNLNKEQVITWLENQVPVHLSHDDEIMIRQLTEYFTTGKGLQNTNNTVVEWLEDIKRKLEKQVEQKPSDEEIKETLRTEYEKGRADVIAEMQKPTWSEEDETYLSHVITAIKSYYTDDKECENPWREELLRWLKSIKDRIQSKQSNKPQGEIAFEAINEEKVDNANKVEPKFKVGDIVQYITDSTDRRKIEEVDTLCNMYHTDSSPIMFEIEDEWEIVVNAEDVEQNPTDKIEPKFKVGDWVIKKDGKQFYNGSKVVQITKIDGNMCYFDCGSWLTEDKIRHWTIEDAKDGDIIYAKSNKLEGYSWIRIFFKLEGGKSWAYCNISSNDSLQWDFSISKDYLKLDRFDFYPATKEQRDLLFQKMKDDGYEWDDEKKELKKIQV